MSHSDNLTVDFVDVTGVCDDQAAEPVTNQADDAAAIDPAEVDRLINMPDDELVGYASQAAEPEAEPDADQVAAEAERLKTAWAATPGATAGMAQEAVDAMALQAARERLARTNGPTPSQSSPLPPPGPGRGYANGSSPSATVSQEEIAAAFAGMADAPKYGPVPSGEYVCRVLGGRFWRGKERGTPAFKVMFQITEGEYVGRRVWLDFYLTGAALAKRAGELKALGLTDQSRMVEALPPIIAAVRVARRQNNRGVFFNEVCSDGVKYIGIAAPEAEPTDAEPDPFDVDAEPVGDQAAEPVDGDIEKNEGVGQ